MGRCSRSGLLLTDTTFRDAHQSLLATRVRTYDMLAIANFVAHRLHDLFSLEMWGGATFDVAMRFLHEDPCARLRQLREAIPNICFQMLLRASNAVGYTAYPDNVVARIHLRSRRPGHRHLPHLRFAQLAAQHEGRHGGRAQDRLASAKPPSATPATSSTPSATSTRWSTTSAWPRNWSAWARTSWPSRTWPACASPTPPRSWSRRCAQEIGIPIHFHTHDTSGINAASVLKAADAGVDIADGAMASMSGTTSQPNLNSIVAALAHTKRDTGLDLDALNQCADYWEVVREYYAPFDTGPKSGTAEVYLHEMPGGQYTNLKEQAESMGLGARWHEIARTYADVNMAFGDIVKVTPSSKVVGDMAIFLVNHNMTMEQFERLDARPQPDPARLRSIEMFMGSLGEPEGGWPKKLQAIILRGAKPQRGRPGAHLPKVDLDETAAAVEKKIGRQPSRDEVLSYLMYPDVFLKFARARQTVRRCRRAAHAAVLLRHAARRGNRRRARAGQDAGHQVPHRRRAASRRHPHGVLRTERPAARSHRPRPQAGSEGSAASRKADPASPARSARPFPAWSPPSPWSWARRSRRATACW